jgi:hypothetical protein
MLNNAFQGKFGVRVELIVALFSPILFVFVMISPYKYI